jgi:hypothetical protein
MKGKEDGRRKMVFMTIILIFALQKKRNAADS